MPKCNVCNRETEVFHSANTMLHKPRQSLGCQGESLEVDHIGTKKSDLKSDNAIGTVDIAQHFSFNQ